MSVTPNEIVTYGSANMPEADSATIGGAVTFTRRVAWYDLSANDTIDAVSSSAADTATKLSLSARDSTGTIQTVTGVTLTGTTVVTNIGSLGTVERMLYGAISGSIIGTFPLANPTGTTAVGDVAVYRHTAVLTARTAQTGAVNKTGTTPPLFKLQSGDGVNVSAGQIIRIKTNTGSNQLRMIIAASGFGTDFVAVNRDWSSIPDSTSTYDVYQGMLFDILPNPVTTITRLFATAAADVSSGSTRIFYEKVFVVNNNTATTLGGAQVEVASDLPALPGGSLLDLALTTTLNDTNNTTNRQTTPVAGLGSFVTQPAFVNVPGAMLPAGTAPNAAGAQGVWLRLTLPAGATAYKGAADIRVGGTTT